MQTFSKDGISIMIVLDKRRVYEECLYKIRIRVIHQRKIWEFTPGAMVTVDTWDELEKKECKKPKVIEIRKDLQSSFDLVKKYVRELSDAGNFTFERMNNRMKAGSDDTINTAFNTKISKLKKDEREGTRLYYDNVLKGIERFKGNKIMIKSVTVSWLKSYEKFLLSEEKAYTTIGFHMRAIRAIMKQAIIDCIAKQSDYPFGTAKEGKYEIPSGEGRHLALTLDQIAEIFKYSDGKETTRYYRDLWIFSYLCSGINFADMLRLKFSDIQNGEINFLREKTKNTKNIKKKIAVYLTQEMQTIIDKWGNIPKTINYIFPVLKGGESQAEIKIIVKNVIRHTNSRMERIGRMLKFGTISTYTARHSWATVLQRSGANISFISESLGHSDITTTGNYLAGFETEARKENAAKLTNFTKIDKTVKPTKFPKNGINVEAILMERLN
jgi:integrase/recombinase XerD